MKPAVFVLALWGGATYSLAQSATFATVPGEVLAGLPVHDPQRNVTLVFGRDSRQLEWDGARQRVNLGVAHPGDYEAVYDPVHREIWTSSGAVWNGVSWRSTTIPNWGLGWMAYDVARQRLVATSASGLSPSGMAEFDGQQWTLITPSTGPGVVGALAYDPVRGCCVMAAGRPISLWTWDGSTWTLLDGSGPAMTATGVYRLRFDPGTSRLILHGGITSQYPPVHGTWAHDASGWTTIATPTTFTEAAWGFGWDGIGLLRLGGVRALKEGIWRLEAAGWRRLPNDYPEPRRTSAPPAFAASPARPELVLFGGYGDAAQALGDTWTLLDRTWTRQTPLHSPSPRGNAGLAWWPTGQRFVLFGGVDGQNQNNVLFDTWTWDGTDWTQLAPANAPTAPLQLVTDPSGGVLGLRRVSWVATNDQWLWNGTTWVNQPSLPAASAGMPWTAAHDAHRNRVVTAVGGVLWEWDGVTWTRIGALPNAVSGHVAVAFRPDTQRMLFLGGNATMEWDGTAWTAVTIANDSWSYLGLAPDFARNRLVSFQHGFSPATHAELTPTPATAQRFGNGCALGPSPGLLTSGMPVPDTPDFGIEVVTLAAHAPCLVTLGFTSRYQPIGAGCAAWILNPPAMNVLVADVTGHARLAVPIPADLNLRGISLLAQAVVFDPPRSVFGGLTFTDGLRIGIGD